MILSYFPLLDSSNSHYTKPYCPYWFVNRHSRTLVVAAGASWTWGNGVPCIFEASDSVVSELDDQYRQQNVYGALVASELCADFLCLSANGSSNFWAATQISTLLELDWLNRYDKIYLIWTSTDPGKGFNSHEDQDVDYNTVCKNIQEQGRSLNELLVHMNTVAVNKFYDKLVQNKKIVFRFGSDWVDPLGFERFDSNRISSKPWAFSLAETSDIVTDPCYVYQDFALDRLIKFVPEFDVRSEVHKEWITQLADSALLRDKVLKQKEFNGLVYRDHPTGAAHAQWADIILRTL